jgi:hypothetical protein
MLADRSSETQAERSGLDETLKPIRAHRVLRRERRRDERYSDERKKPAKPRPGIRPEDELPCCENMDARAATRATGGPQIRQRCRRRPRKARETAVRSQG